MYLEVLKKVTTTSSYMHFSNFSEAAYNPNLYAPFIPLKYANPSDFILLPFCYHNTEKHDIKREIKRQFMKSGQGRKWLDEFESGTWPDLGG
jgi:hypothetical protein